jgi:hypothetical protein
MRCKSLIAVLLAAVFLLGTVVPAVADNGKHRKILDVVCKDHPWQDDNASSGNALTRGPLVIFIGPLTFTVNVIIPITKKLPQNPLKSASNTTTQKNVEKSK